MKVIDSKRSEYGPQRRKTHSGRLLHCCCICGRVDTWGETWACYSSLKEEDDGEPIPKFCSAKCRQQGGEKAERVTAEMTATAQAAEFREPTIVYREATDHEKYAEARHRQQRPHPSGGAR
jgi:hypothetical protein